MDNNNEEITIIELDTKKTRKSNKAPARRLMYLKLSKVPTYEWIQIFNNERENPRHNMWRHASIEGGYIVIDCVPEEIKSHHLEDLTNDVINTNNRYSNYGSLYK